MSKPTFAATQIEVSSEEATLDEHVKNVLAIRPFLARIIKGTVSEAADFSLEEIVDMIEGDPQIGTAAVDAGLSNNPRITGMTTEDTVPFEGTITYDVLTYIVIPLNGERIRIIINVEGQNNTTPGYDLVTRGIYYVARRISAQKGTEFSGSDYDNIKKVYSIWICFNSGKAERNTITEYHMTKDNIYGMMPDTERYDLMSVVFVRLGGSLKEYQEDTLQRFLMQLFSAELTYKEKQRILSEEYGIAMSEDEGEEVSVMCNYSQGIKEQGRTEGRAEGRAEGISIGEIKERLNSIRNMRTLGVSDEQLLSVGYTEEELAAES